MFVDLFFTFIFIEQTKLVKFITKRLLQKVINTPEVRYELDAKKYVDSVSLINTMI